MSVKMSSVMSVKMSMSSVMSKGLMIWASEVVSIVASEYNLDKEKCMSLIESTWETGVSGSGSVRKSVKSSSSSISSKVKKLIPLPFNRERVDMNGCHGLSYNHGLFTQCENKKLEEETYCNSCKTETETSSSGKPLCGTIEDRTDPEFKDSENRKPVHYLSVLRKLRVKPEAAIEEAGKQNITIDSFHLQDLPKPVKVVKEKVIKEKPIKEPKPVKEKPIKEVKEKPVKEKAVKEVKEKVIKEVKEKKESVGRPKSTKKPIETAAVEDLFASLVAEEISNASGSESEVEVEVEVKKVEVNKVDKKTELNSEKQERATMQNEEKEQKQKEASAAKEKKLKDAAEAKEKKLKDAAEAKEKKAAEVAAAKLEKEAAIALEKEKKAQEIAAAKDKKLKDAAVAKIEKEKKAEAVASKKANEVSVIQEPVAPVEVKKVTVKKITIDGKEYLKSSTNMLYDPKTTDEVGIYNTETGGIDALPEESDDEEEVEDDYDSEDN